MARLGRRQHFRPIIRGGLVSGQSGIQFDSASNSGYQTAQSSYSWNHTCSGNNRYLVVGISLLSVAGSSVSSITYNGVSLTAIGNYSSVSGTIRVDLWGLVAPASGTNSIAVTLSAGLDSVGNASSWSGVHQSVPLDDNLNNPGSYFSSNRDINGASSANAIVSTNTATNSIYRVGIVATNDTAPSAFGDPYTETGRATGALGAGTMSYDGPKSPGVSNFTPETLAGLKSWVVGVAFLRPISAGTGATSSGTLLLLGCGA